MAIDLPALRRATGEASLGWQPGETSHSGLSPLAARSRLGAVPPGGRPTLALREQAATAMLAQARTAAGGSAAAPPSHVDWRDVGGASYVSAVRDQAGCGSCVAFGTTAVLESMVRIAAEEPALPVDLSEAYVFFCLGPHHGAGACPEGGWWPDDALAAMASGVSDEANFPYTDADQPCGRGADWASRLTRFRSWTRKTSISAMKRYLASVGPMAACFSVYEDFYYYTGGVYRYHKATSGDLVGGHCVQVIGYDDATSCWLARNSWGTGWGEDGFFRIAYGTAGFDAEMWGIDGTVTSPLIRRTLQVFAVGSGNVWRTRRTPSGGWLTPVERVDTGTPGDPGAFTAVSVAATINRLHVVGLVGGTPWYTRKRTGAGWAKWEKPGSTRPSAAGAFTAVACTAVGDSLHLVGLAGGGLWHTWRTPTGTWQKTWARATPAGGDPGPFTALACLTSGTRAAVVAVADAQLWLLSRKSDGTWTAPDLITAAGPAPGPITAVAAATVDGLVHVVALCQGRAWHLQRSASREWGTWRELTSVDPGVPATFDAIGCAGVGRDLRVLALSAGRLWYTSRQPDGTWRASFADLGARLTGEPAQLVSVDGA